MQQPPWRIVLFTNLGDFAERFEPMLGMFGHNLAGIVTSPGPARNRTTSYIDVVQKTRPGIDVIVSTRPKRWARMIEPLRPDLIMSFGFPWLIPDDVLALPPLGAINIHASSLPKYRGPHPIGWAFRNGDTELGLTVHRLDDQFDTGNILATGSIPIDERDQFSTVADRYGQLLFGLLGEAFGRVAQGDPGDPQDEAQASDAPFFEPGWRYVDWTNPAKTIHNQVRSWTGDRGIPKGALAEIDGQTVRVIHTRLVSNDGQPGDPGAVVRRDGDTILMQCGDGPIEVVEHEIEP